MSPEIRTTILLRMPMGCLLSVVGLRRRLLPFGGFDFEEGEPLS